MALLPSWRPGPTRDTIVAFLDAAMSLPVERRVAVVDHDGTLYCERPLTLAYEFYVHELKATLITRPELAERAEYRLVLEGDRNVLAAFGMRRMAVALLELAGGLTPEEFADRVRSFLTQDSHPSGLGFRQMVYQPMRELIDALHARGFAVFVDVPAGIEVVRAISPGLYSVPPECVVGRLMDFEYQVRDGGPVLVRGPRFTTELSLSSTNVVNFYTQTGRHPILAAGNSAGDRELLEYALASRGPSLALLIDHDDPERDYSYQEHIVVELEEEVLTDFASRDGWTTVSIRDDWSTVFPESVGWSLGESNS